MSRIPDRIEFPSDGSSRWAGMADLVLLSPDGSTEVFLRYAGEPPHGDSFHRAEIHGRSFPGHIWGAMFAFTPDGRYLACSWKSQRADRRTIVIDLADSRYFVLPEHIGDFSLQWPVVSGTNAYRGLRYTFDGSERWLPF